VLREDELGRATADVDDEDVVERRTARGDAADHHRGLLLAGQQTRREAVAPLDLTEEGFAVLRVAHRAGRDAQRALGAEGLELLPIVHEAVADAGNRDREEPVALVDAFAQPRDGQSPRDLVDAAVLDVCDEESGRVRPEIDRCDAGHRPLGR
jgi:hypothetical protein